MPSLLSIAKHTWLYGLFGWLYGQHAHGCSKQSILVKLLVDAYFSYGWLLYRTNNINVNVPRHRCIRSNDAKLINIIAAFKEGMTQFFNFMKKFFLKRFLFIYLAIKNARLLQYILKCLVLEPYHQFFVLTEFIV